jgi:hypothetical protein
VTYGEPTPTAAVPLSGVGTYAIDLIGAYGAAAINQVSIYAITGQGQLGIDFATGKLVLGGTTTGGAMFTGSGTLSSTGSFTGPLDIDTIGYGQLTGRLYGPGAQEVGGSFYLSNNNGDAVGSGVIIGRSETASTPATSFATINSPQFQTVASSRQYTGGTGTSGIDSLELGLVGATGLATILTPGYYQSLSFAGQTSGNSIGSVISSPNMAVRFVNVDAASLVNPDAYSSNIAPYTAPYTTQYVYGAVSSSWINSNHLYDYFLIGIDTPVSALPTTGFAGYSVDFDGAIANQKTGIQPTEVTGSGTIGINFGSGQVTTSGATSIGNFSGTGTLASGTNSFTGSLSVGGTTTYSGSMQGSVFGPTASEVGAVFNATGSDGTDLAGLMTGTANNRLVDPNATLGSLTAPTVLPTNESAYGLQGSLVESGSTQVAYDPTSKTYTVSSTSAAYTTGLPAASAVLGPSNVDSANSNATFTAYSEPNLAARIFNTGAANPVIQLSYVSFAQITQTEPNGPNGTSYPVDHFEVFGLPTSSTNAPTTGSATYSGVVYGKGYDPAVSNGDLALGGTGQLSANFGTGAMSTTLNLNATPVGGGTAQSLGSYTFTGTTSGGAFSGQTPTTTSVATGIIQGNFYGPTASEVGAAFTINLPSANGNPVGATNLAGVFLGKKN